MTICVLMNFCYILHRHRSMNCFCCIRHRSMILSYSLSVLENCNFCSEKMNFCCIQMNFLCLNFCCM